MLLMAAFWPFSLLFPKKPGFESRVIRLYHPFSVVVVTHQLWVIPVHFLRTLAPDSPSLSLVFSNYLDFCSVSFTDCCGRTLEHWFSIRGDFCPQGTFGDVWRRFWLLPFVVWVLLASSVVASRNIAQQPRVHRIRPPWQNMSDPKCQQCHCLEVTLGSAVDFVVGR